MRIEKLRNYSTYEGVLLINSERIKALGIEWKLLVQVTKFQDITETEDTYVGLYLYANQTPRK